MASLTGCLAKLGKNISRENKAAIMRLAKDLRDEGLGATEAAIQAAQQQRETLVAARAAAGQAKAAAPAAPVTDKAEIRPYRRADGSIGYEAVPIVAPAAAPVAPRPSANTVFTEDAAEKARARLKAKLGRLSSGIDPEMLMDGITLAGYHIEKGARKFAAFARAMVEDLGDGVKPYLQSWYMAVRSDPRAAEFKADMDKASKVEDLTAEEIDALLVPEVTQAAQEQSQALAKIHALVSNRADRNGKYTPPDALKFNAAVADARKAGIDVSTQPPGTSGTVVWTFKTDDGSTYAAYLERSGKGTWLALGAAPSESGTAPAPAPAQNGGTEAPNADALQPQQLPDAGAAPDRTDAAAGDGDRQPLDAGVAGEGEGTDLFGAVPGRPQGAGKRGARSPGQRDGQAPRAPRDRAGVGPEPGAADDFDLAGEDIGSGGLTRKYRDNVAAIRILKALESEGRPATADERRALARYVGWGALKGVFDPENKQWAKQHQELRGLLNDREWAAAAASTLNAHYTSPVVVNAMYSALRRIGATRGRVLEPSVGSGNFLGLMPKDIRSGMQVFGVELDPITSRIAAGLYPSAKIRNEGFEDFDVPGGFFDIAVGNPPFGPEPLVDMHGSPYSGWSIHNYFFAKTIDKLRPGGVMAMVVSHNFLDAQDAKTRQWIAKRARLVGAVRLPRTAFKENAGTEVVTDIVIFQKTTAGESSPPWLEVVDQENTNPKTGDLVTHKVNRYFIDNPGNVLGTPSAAGTMYGPNEYTVEPAGDLDAALAKWQESLPEGIYEAVDRTAKMQAAEVPDGVKVGSYFVADDGTIMVRTEDEIGERRALAWTAPNDKAVERVKGMIRLRTALRAQMRLERSHDAAAEQIEAHRRDLNRFYDEFHKAHGFVNDPTNRRLFLDDTEASLVLALEFDYDRGVSAAVAEREGIEPRKPSAKKADIFSRRVLFPPQDNVQVTNARDAMLASLNFKGTLDLPYMAKLYGKEPEAIVRELGDLVYTEPGGEVVTADDYLSGDVKTKLAEAEMAARTDPAMRRNVEALQKVIPEDKKPSEIHAAMGAKFIDGAVLEEFAKRTTGANVTAVYVKALGQWVIDGSGSDAVLNTSQWGTVRAPALSIIQQTIAGKSVVVTDTFRNGDGTTTTVVNEKETEAAREKQRALKEEWQTWLWSDPERATKIAGDYNEQMNRWVDRRYDGSHLTLPGKVPDEVITLIQHQKNGVWRALQSRQILLDHVVGAGKTFQMVAIAMEMRRMGIARKPFFAVPNHLTLQWASEFARLYPGANVLAATPDDFAKGNREKFFSKIVTGDWDAVIVGHSSLKKIGLPIETEKAVLEEQVQEISDAIEAMKRSRGDSRIVGDMQRIKKNLEGKLKEKLQAIGSRDKVVTFDELGVDAMFVDELHEFKNLFYTSTMDRVPGMGNPTGSAKAFDLFVKLQWMFNTFGSNAPIIGATGTPVSNSLVEMFNMQRFMQYPQLKAEGLNVFDAWARQFGSVENVYEVSPSGTGYRSSNRFSKFKNLGALMAHYNAFADVVTLDDLKAQEEARGKRFPVPKIRGGRPAVVVAERSPQVAMFMGVPEIKTEDGQALFGINAKNLKRVKFEEKDGKVHASVGIVWDDGKEGTVALGAYATEADARMAVVEKALSPEIGVDPQSILGKFQNLRQLTKDTKGKVNALSLTGAANKAGLDYRLIDPSAPDFPGSKINLAIGNMMAEYERWSADRGAQLVFCDLSVPLSERNNLATKARRVYVREDGALSHKKGTMHTAEGFESLPFFLVPTGAGATKAVDAYDAASGMLLRKGFKTKAEALSFVGELLKNEAKRQQWIDARERTGELTQELIDEYNDANEIDTAESPVVTLQDIAGVSAATAFSVYDDIKAKLLARGVPESEIAFIHDYDTPTAKDKLFKAVNRGDVRFLLGSTPKMGAGTNVQKRLVALHHIDAPWRPSDLEQREGRIIRRGNELYERDPDGFEIGIYRYATKQTYDTRRWQILEHKARGIEQLRNYDGTTNEIDDIDGEAANAAEMKAAASGDPLILKETQLRTDVKRLENLQAAHADAVADFARKARTARDFHTKYGPKERAEYEKLAALVARFPVPEDGLPEGSTVDGRRLTDRKEFTQAIARAAAEVANSGSPVQKTIEYRGLTFTLDGGGQSATGLNDRTRGGFGTSLGLWFPGEPVSATGIVQRLGNYVERIGEHIARVDAEIAKAVEAEPKWIAESKKPFAQAQELTDAREQHKRVQRLLIARGPEIPEAQKPLLAAGLERQRAALREAGFGDTLDELMAFSDATGDGDTRMSRTTGARRGGVPMDDARAVVATIREALPKAPPVHIHETLAQAPKALREIIRAQGGEFDTEAAYHEGEIHVFPRNIASVERMRFVVGYHEVRHHGIRSMLGTGDTMGSVMHAMWSTNPRVRQAAQAKIDAGLARSRVEAVEEALADMPVAAVAKLNGFGRLVAGIRRWLRQTAIRLRRANLPTVANAIDPARWTDDDIVGFVLAAESVSVDGAATYRTGGTVFQRAAGSAGAVAQTDTEARFSRAPATQRVTQVFDDLVKSQASFNFWHRTVGTQFHKAKVHSGFGKVYGLAQEYLHDTSAFANDPSDLAPDLLPQLKDLGDMFKRLALKESDRKAISRAVFEGTLAWTRDDSGQLQPAGDEDTPGVVFTPEELRAEFGLTNEQVKLYQQFRRATDRSLDILVASDVARLLGENLPPAMKAMISQGDTGRFKGLVTAHLDASVAKALADLEEARRVQRNEMGRIGRRQREALAGPSGRAGSRLATLEKFDAERKEAKFRNGQRVYLAQQALQNMEAFRQQVKDKYERIAELKGRGYAPLMRFGRYTVDVIGEDGSREFFGLYETEREANAAAREFRSSPEFEGAVVSQGILSEEAYKQFSGLTPETIELFAEVAGVEKTALFEEYLRRAKNNRSAMKRLIRRSGVAGFSDDVTRVLAAFVTSNARASSSALHMGDVAAAVEEIPKEQGDVRDEAIKLREYVQNPQEEAQGIRSLLFAQYLGGSVASAMVNMTQPIMMTLPWLSQHIGPAAAARRLAAAARTAVGTVKPDSELGRALKMAEKEGIVSPQELHQLQAEASRTLGNHPGVRRLLFGWGAFFSLAEQFNRRVSFIAAFEAAKARGDANPFAFAANAVDETQGVYTKANRPNWARGAIGATLFTFKQYSVTYVEFLKRLPRREQAIALAILILAAGAGGLPGSDDLDDVIDTVGQHMGYDINAKLWKVRVLNDAVGEDLAAFLLHGMSSWLPLDVSARLGLGNLIPGTGLLLKSRTDKASEVTEAIGPFGSTVVNTVKALPAVLKGDLGKANDIAGPVAFKNLGKGLEMYLTGQYRDQAGRKVVDVTSGEAAIKAVGFQPSTVAEGSRRAQMANQQVALARNVEAEIASEWARGVVDGDADAVRKARARLAKWNADNPQSRIGINTAQITRRVREMRMSRDERFTKRTPKEMRASTAEIVG